MAVRISRRWRMKTLKLIWLNVAFYTGFVLYSATAIPVFAVFMAVTAPFDSRRGTMRRLRLLLSLFGRVVLHVLPFPFLKVEFDDREPNSGPGPFIAVCNHRSMSDAVLMAVLPFELVQVVNIWPFRIPVFGGLARLAGYLSVHEMDLESFISESEKRLKEGVSVVCFPEGTRSGNREMNQFHGAIFRLALQAKKPIVPICISGNERIPDRGSMVLRPGLIRVRKLPAVPPEAYESLSAFQIKTRIWRTMDEELRRMDGEPRSDLEGTQPGYEAGQEATRQSGTV